MTSKNHKEIIAKFKNMKMSVVALQYSIHRDCISGTLVFADEHFLPKKQIFDLVCNDVSEEELAIIGCRCESINNQNGSYNFIAKEIRQP